MSYYFKISILAKLQYVIFIKKLQKLPSAGAPFPYPLASGGEAPRPPMASGSWEFRPQTPPNPNLIQKSWLRHWHHQFKALLKHAVLQRPTVR